MSKQPQPAPTASAVDPCPTLIQISRTPWQWKFTQHHRTTRPPPGSTGSTWDAKMIENSEPFLLTETTFMTSGLLPWTKK